MNRLNGKALTWALGNLVLVGGMLLLFDGCGSSDIAGLNDLKTKTESAIKSVTTAFEKVKDEETAKAEIPDLNKADEQLSAIMPAFEKLPEAGKKVIFELLKSQYPKIKELINKALALVKNVDFKAVAESILKKLGKLSNDSTT